ncbi:hypothetical protein COY43_02615 [Candidatus Berkelbacteria bacterium CG_4_10_14_0_8_um_filter_35_9_33_8]|nr:MAG: hypothetical protein COX10_01615 [Candidatus Berkelbacteria bacterium CG23_combo_of_CG06-09_8_20_14_all_33_15]PIZ28060.1 MAG: hypothetical protein COY43_02615 [Candidatus Berkelbacteria bacterium CG_4_10_14_0_8_um_filter_35_9_33_8]PJB51197.1 MAG: hypothetical protein CO100_02430 [Candidatus Berkelbacteria bacterium CG_4_9_14_3_um_filter_33_5]
MNKLLAQNKIIPRGFDGVDLKELPVIPGEAVEKFFNNQNIIVGDKIANIQATLVIYAKIAFSYASYILLIALIYSGVKYMVAGSDETKLTSAKKNIYWSTIGYAIVVLAYSIVNFISNGIFKDSLVKYSKPIKDKYDIINNLAILFTNVIKSGLGIIGLVFLLILLFNGFKYLISAGGEGTETAKKSFVNAIIGLVFIACSYGITIYIQQTITLK